jgi:YVTN family beta-propeller protein
VDDSLEFLILGPLEVRRGSTTLQLGSAKQRALLGVLLLHPNEAVSTARLVDELWGEHPPATAEKLVQGYVHALRKQLGDGVLETRAPGYRIAVDAGSSDLAAFGELTSTARSAPLPESVEVRKQALALWRGTPLADVVLEGPARHTVTRVGELRLTTQIEQIDAELALGRHAQLIGELEALTVAHPYQEKLAGQLMRALYRSGRQADALEVYRTIRARLDDELGLEPSQELRDLESAILRHDPSLAVAPAVESSSSRVPELDDLGPAASPVRRRRGRLVAVLAPAAALAVLAYVATDLVREDPAPLSVPPNSVAVIGTSSNRVERVIPVGIRPGDLAYGEGAVWVANLEDRSLSRIDPETRTVVRNVPLPATPDSVAVGEGAVWVVNGRLGTLYRIDPAFDRVSDGLRLGERAITFTEAGVAVGRGSVWAAFGDSTLARVDTSPLREAGLTVAGEGPSDVVVAFDSVWVSNSGDSTVQRFSPLTFEAGNVRELTVGRRPTGMAAGDDSLWVACTEDDYVARLESSSGFESARTVPVGDGPRAIATGDDAVWVANAADGTVSRIDPGTNEVVDTITVGNAPAGIAFVDGSVWVSVQAP